MAVFSELGYDECVDLLRSGVVGRVALSTPGGPHIVPVNYAVLDRSVVVATSPYSVLGTYGRHNTAAFEVDGFDADTQDGWSVLVRGLAQPLDPVELRRLADQSALRPWPDGSRVLVLRIPWTELSGRRVGRRAAATTR
jgi:nitroimidazol reductase NimA-like FMN-containing flavoprotein (pyridoxamine 5'-phosphate oxidase superfamily)